MTRWVVLVVVALLIGALMFHSCRSCGKGRQAEEVGRAFPTPARGFSVPTHRWKPKVAFSRPTARPEVEPEPPAATPPAAASNAELPNDFPEDVPLFKGSEVFAVQQLAGDAKNVLFHVDADRPRVFRHYRTEMQQKGWKLTQEYQARQQSFLSFSKGGRIAQMTISTDPSTGKRVVAIMYQKQEPLPFSEF